MAPTFPRFTLIKLAGMKHSFAAYVGEVDGVPGSVFLDPEEGAFNPLTKIEVERAKIDDKYIHLRFSHSNKYWARNNAEDGFLVGQSNQPEEDTSDPSCTLFEPTTADDTGSFFLIHVHSGMRVQTMGTTIRFLVTQGTSDMDYLAKLVFVDWETIVKLPAHVALKGDNGKYLQPISNNLYLQFLSDDPNDQASAYQIHLIPDGSVRIKSDHTGKLLRRDPNWIKADRIDDETLPIDDNIVFWPVRIDGNTIALRNGGNSYFCKRLTIDGNTDCLNAGVPTITVEARMGVQELVMDRKIYDVEYRMEDARIFDVTPYLAGTTTAVNESDVEASIAVSVTYTDERSYSFSNSLSITAGVTTSIEAGVPGIEESSIQISFEISTTLEWSSTTTNTTSITATGSVPVPPNSTAVVNYVGTRGSCDVPFNYTQSDKSSTDGKIVPTQQVDGIFNGVNSYNFYFQVEKIQPL